MALPFSFYLYSCKLHLELLFSAGASPLICAVAHAIATIPPRSLMTDGSSVTKRGELFALIISITFEVFDLIRRARSDPDGKDSRLRAMSEGSIASTK